MQRRANLRLALTSVKLCPKEREHLTMDGFRTALAKAIAKGTEEYLIKSGIFQRE